MAQQKDNAGALFKNDKGDNERRPDYRGPLMVNGTEGELAAWLSKSKDGKPYMSLKWQPKDDKPQSGGQGRDHQAPLQGGGDIEDDSVPFAPIKLA